MKRYKKELRLSSFENLRLCIYVIGYKNIGESIVILFKDKIGDDYQSFFSFVIDCYKNDSVFVTRKILDKNEVKGIDAICWTHPHKDHTPGIDEILKDYYKDGMWVFLPKFYFGNLQRDLLKSESQFTQETYNSINNILKEKKSGIEIRKTITANGDMTCHYPILMRCDDDSTRDLDFYFLTPHSGLIDKYTIPGNELSRPNDLSVSFVMSVDGYDFYFGGDTECEHANAIDKSIIHDMRWIKVPHHCSNGATVICDNLGQRFDYAASTVFESSNLPIEDIQNKYAEKGRLFMTQLRNGTLVHEYGVVEFDYTFRDDDILVDIHTYGNASEYCMGK